MGGAIQEGLAVTNGTIYGAENNELFALDANGNTNCSGTPKICEPLWTANAGGNLDSPAVANGVVYSGSLDGKLYAFDASGNTGCSGSPKTCVPLWTGKGGGQVEPEPVVAGGVVYVTVTVSGTSNGALDAFDAKGTTNCTGSPKACSPLWTAALGSGLFGAVAVANGTVFTGSSDHSLYWFDASGVTGCSGTPKTCTPIARATAGAGGGAVIANGVVYIATDNQIEAFDAAHTANCSGTPTTCTALWTATSSNGVDDRTVANGVVYFGSDDGILHAYTLP